MKKIEIDGKEYEVLEQAIQALKTVDTGCIETIFDFARMYLDTYPELCQAIDAHLGGGE